MANKSDKTQATETTTNTAPAIDTGAEDTGNTDAQQSVIDRAVAAAKARAAAKAAAGGKTPKATEATEKKEKKEKAPKAKKEKTVKAAKVEPTAEQIEESKAAKAAAKAEKEAKRAADKALRDAEREVKKAEREAKKSAKAAERASTRKPAHMGKVEKAGAKLPNMGDAVRSVYDLVTGSDLTEGQMAILGAHLAHFNRVRATVRSAECSLTEGQTVEIVSSDRDARLIGLRGTVAQVRKIRVLVDIPGHAKQAYLFLSDVAPCASESVGTVEPEANEPEFLAPEVEETAVAVEA